MANNPLVNFHFQVNWGGTNLGFSEVSGLNIEIEVVEYRDGLSPVYSTRKMPGMQKVGNIILKRGVFEWLNTVKLNTVERRDMIITILNAEHSPVVVWKVKNAWPSKIQYADLKAVGNEVAIESMEIVHEGLTVENS